MNSDTILEGRLWPRIGLDHAPTINQNFQSNSSHRGHLARQLLLYDRILFPTNDFGIIPALIDWMGSDAFYQALEANSFSFLRLHGILGYSGNGVGLSFFVLKPSASAPKVEWWQDAMFGDLEKSAELQLQNIRDSIDSGIRRKILSKVLSCSTELNFDEDFFKRDFQHGCYKDIAENPKLSNLVFSHLSTDRVDLINLPGIAANQIRVSTLGEINDPIGLVLRVAEVNLEIVMASLSGKCDLFTSEDANTLVEHKLRRAGLAQQYIEGFSSLLELNNLPDIGEAVEKGAISLERICKLRETRASKDFRKWLKEVQPQDIRELEKAYVAAISQEARVDSLPVKALRFIITTAVGIVNPIAGLLTDSIDSFFVDKWLKGFSPKMFFDELRKLKLK